MLKIGILGYGKMGKAIEDVATKQGIEIVWRIGHSNKHELTTDLLRKADVAIEFSSPEAAFDHVLKCLEAGVPVVSGTTGWNDKLPEAQGTAKPRMVHSFGPPISALASMFSSPSTDTSPNSCPTGRNTSQRSLKRTISTNSTPRVEQPLPWQTN